MYNSDNFLQGRRNKELQSGRQKSFDYTSGLFQGISHAGLRGESLVPISALLLKSRKSVMATGGVMFSVKDSGLKAMKPLIHPK